MVVVMHPGYKLSKFKQFNYSNSWITAARKLVREEFDARYMSASDAASDSGLDAAVDNASVPVRVL